MNFSFIVVSSSCFHKIKVVFDQWVCIKFDVIKEMIDSYYTYMLGADASATYKDMKVIISGLYCHEEGFADFIRESGLLQDPEIVAELEEYFHHFNTNKYLEEYLEDIPAAEWIELCSEQKLLEFIMLEMCALEMFESIVTPIVLK